MWNALDKIVKFKLFRIRCKSIGSLSFMYKILFSQVLQLSFLFLLFLIVDKMGDQQFFLKWNDFQTNMVTSFRHLRDEKSFTDVSSIQSYWEIEGFI